MSLTGDFKNVHLGDILQALQQKRRVGTLTVRHRVKEKRIAFSAEGMRLLSGRTITGFPLGKCLTDQKAVSEHQLKSALEEQSRSGGLLGAVIVRLGYCGEETIREATRFQASEELYELFTWDSAIFTFDEGDPSSSSSSPLAGIRFDVGDILIEAERRMEDWHYFLERVGNLDEVFARSDQADGAPDIQEHGLAMAKVYWIVDGYRNVRSVVSESPLSVFETARLLLRLIAEGFLRPCEQDELVKVAKRSVLEKEFGRAAHLLERAHRRDPRRVDILEALVACFERVDEKKKAAEPLTLLGRILLDEGSPDAGRQALEKAARYNLRSVEVRLLLTREHMQAKEYRRAAERAKEAASLLADRGEYDKAVEICRAPLAKLPDHLGLRTALANFYLMTGREELALSQLERVASLLEAAGSERKLAEIREKILQIDPSRSDLIALTRPGSVTDKLRRTDRRILLVAAGAVAIVVLLLAMAAIPGNESSDRLAISWSRLRQGQVDRAETEATNILVDEGESDRLTALLSAIARYRREAKGPTREVEQRQLDELEGRSEELAKDFLEGELFSAIEGARKLLNLIDDDPSYAILAKRLGAKRWARIREFYFDSVEDQLRRYSDSLLRRVERAELALDGLRAQNFATASGSDLQRLLQRTEVPFTITDPSADQLMVDDLGRVEALLGHDGPPIVETVRERIGEMSAIHAECGEIVHSIQAYAARSKLYNDFNAALRKARHQKGARAYTAARTTLEEILARCEMSVEQAPTEIQERLLKELMDDDLYDIDGQILKELRELPPK